MDLNIIKNIVKLRREGQSDSFQFILPKNNITDHVGCALKNEKYSFKFNKIILFIISIMYNAHTHIKNT